MSQLYGVDVSEFQGQINWDVLNSVANFVIIRASFGTARQDYQFARNQSEARRVRAAAGPLGIGYYYYAYPTLVDAVTSANYFVDNLGGLQDGEVLALDLEGNVGSDPVGWSLSFLNQVESRTTVKPLIYLNQSLMNSYDWSPVINGGFGLWIADYDFNQTTLPPSGKWPFAAIKQWTDKDPVAGISGQVDGDTFQGDFTQFFAYGYHAATTPAPVPEPTPPVVVSPVDPITPPTPPPVISPTPPSVPPVTSQPSPRKSFWQWLLATLKGILGR